MNLPILKVRPQILPMPSFVGNSEWTNGLFTHSEQSYAWDVWRLLEKHVWDWVWYSVLLQVIFQRSATLNQILIDETKW